MANAATLSGPSTTAGGTAGTTGNGKAPAGGLVAFTRASKRHREPFFDYTVTQSATATQTLPTVGVPAYGYARAVVIQVTATGGAGTSVTANADSPFSALQNISLQEPNGNTLVQFSSGYHLMLANKFGGYRHANDPRADLYSYGAVASGTGNYSFMIRIPIELNERTALGCLPNQNAAAQFLVKATLAAGGANGAIYGATAPTTQPSVNVKYFLEAWDQPDTSLNGLSNETEPPAVNTTQFWTEQQFSVNAGQQTIRLTRMGNYIRHLGLVFRSGSGTTRANGQGDWPDPLTIMWDTRPLDYISKANWVRTVYERYGYQTSTSTGSNDVANFAENGVYWYDFAHEFTGKVGYEMNDDWLATLATSRLELQGNFATAGTLTVLTNDIAPMGNVFV